MVSRGLPRQLVEPRLVAVRTRMHFREKRNEILAID
jgi:hypothetical protein